MVTLRCAMCGGRFEPTAAQRAASNRSKHVTLTCETHGHRIVDDDESDAPMLRCPRVQCDGWVAEGLDTHWPGPFGCGECGTFWPDRPSLFADVDIIIDAFPYRRRCYARTVDGWRPARNQPQDERYEERVEREPTRLPKKRRRAKTRGA